MAAQRYSATRHPIETVLSCVMSKATATPETHTPARPIRAARGPFRAERAPVPRAAPARGR